MRLPSSGARSSCKRDCWATAGSRALSCLRSAHRPRGPRRSCCTGVPRAASPWRLETRDLRLVPSAYPLVDTDQSFFFSHQPPLAPALWAPRYDRERRASRRWLASCQIVTLTGSSVGNTFLPRPRENLGFRLVVRFGCHRLSYVVMACRCSAWVGLGGHGLAELVLGLALVAGGCRLQTAASRTDGWAANLVTPTTDLKFWLLVNGRGQ